MLLRALGVVIAAILCMSAIGLGLHLLRVFVGASVVQTLMSATNADSVEAASLRLLRES
jgi:hypothetical protein